MTVSFSCRCPNADYLGFETSPEAIIRTAAKADELGFDAVFANDHIIVDSSPRSAPWTNTYDPFVALSFMAANTKHIGLGISVLIVPYRNPITTAKALATFDRMSGGRLICGVGVGWNRAEFAALGVNFHERGARTNEYLRIWQACWAPGETSFAGRFFSFANMHASPKPLRQPHPPLWVGGTSVAALRRAAAFADTLSRIVNLESAWDSHATTFPYLSRRNSMVLIDVFSFMMEPAILATEAVAIHSAA
jgi:probable F420-dependent oxidoreductase